MSRNISFPTCIETLWIMHVGKERRDCAYISLSHNSLCGTRKLVPCMAMGIHIHMNLFFLARIILPSFLLQSVNLTHALWSMSQICDLLHPRPLDRFFLDYGLLANQICHSGQTLAS